jgi:hypothetical protein
MKNNEGSVLAENKAAPKRLSLQDFKVKAFDNKTELEKITGGVAAGCHPITVELPDGNPWTLSKVKYD